MIAIENDTSTIHSVDQPRAFPLPGTMLYDLISKPGFKQQFQPKIKLTNRVVVPLYKTGLLSLLGMNKRIMLLTTKGRKTQKMRAIPIGYFRIEEDIYVFSGWGKQANWYRNLVTYPEHVVLQIGFHRYRVHPEVVEEFQEIKRILTWLIDHKPDDAKVLMGWDPQRDQLETADFSLMIQKVLTVRFRLKK